MDKDFETGLAEIKKIDPQRAIEVIFRLFHSVENMSFEQIIAAKRTLDLFRSLSQVDESGTKVLTAIDRALRARAGIYCQGDSKRSSAVVLAFNHNK